MIQPVMMRTRGLYGPFYQRYKGGWVHSVGNKFSASLLQQILAIPGIAGYWMPQPGYVFEDAAATIPATINGVVGCCNSVSTPAIQATTAVKPYWRKTPTSNVYWLDSNTATSALTATLGNLGSACTVAQAGAEGVTFTENVTISSTYNIANAFGFNSDIAIFNRALTTTEKALVTRYMQRSVPVLGANTLTNGSFDTNVTGWNTDSLGTFVWSDGRGVLTNTSAANRFTGSIDTIGLIGKFYIATCNGISNGVAAPRLALGTAPFVTGTTTAGVEQTLKVVGTPTLYAVVILYAMGAIGSSASFDNVTCKEIL